jgi:hypothetical protein
MGFFYKYNYYTLHIVHCIMYLAYIYINVDVNKHIVLYSHVQMFTDYYCIHSDVQILHVTIV